MFISPSWEQPNTIQAEAFKFSGFGKLIYDSNDLSKLDPAYPFYPSNDRELPGLNFATHKKLK